VTGLWAGLTVPRGFRNDGSIAKFSRLRRWTVVQRGVVGLYPQSAASDSCNLQIRPSSSDRRALLFSCV